MYNYFLDFTRATLAITIAAIPIAIPTYPITNCEFDFVITSYSIHYTKLYEQGLDDIPISKIMKPILFVKETTTMQESAKIMLEKGVSSLTISYNFV